MLPQVTFVKSGAGACILPSLMATHSWKAQNTNSYLAHSKGYSQKIRRPRLGANNSSSNENSSNKSPSLSSSQDFQSLNFIQVTDSSPSHSQPENPQLVLGPPPASTASSSHVDSYNVAYNVRTHSNQNHSRSNNGKGHLQESANGASSDGIGDLNNGSNALSSNIISYSNYYKEQNSKTYGQLKDDVMDHNVQKATSEEEKLQLVEEALSKAKSSLDNIEKFQSVETNHNNLKQTLTQIAKQVWNVICIGSLCTLLVLSHGFGIAVQWTSAVANAVGLALWGYRKGSLNLSGAIAGFIVGLGTLGCSLRLGATLVAFYVSSSKLTQYKEELKVGLDDAGKKGGQRDWIQVVCNAGVPTVLAIAYGVLAGCVDLPMGPLGHVEAWRAKLSTLLMGGFLGYYACCCGDTWASELGPLSSDTPRLITTLKPVRRGTNGGVTLLGLSASIFGGMFVGLIFYAAAIVSPTIWVMPVHHASALAQWRLIPLGLMAGLFGSALDSLLGATLQYSGYNRMTRRVTSTPGPDVVRISGMPFFSNNAVNAVSATMTAGLTAIAAFKMFGF